MKRMSPSASKAKKPAKQTAAAPAKKNSKSAAPARPSLEDFISSTLDSDKAQDIIAISLKGKTAIAESMLIATGTSSRHVSSMAQKLRDKLNSDRKIKARLEGMESGDWVIVDAGDVMVHLFREEVREFYDLEKLWGADFSTVNYTRYQSV